MRSREYASEQTQYGAQSDTRLMHALSFHRRRLQRIVGLTLVGWVFALASGVVNACLSAPEPTPRSGLAQQISVGKAARDAHVSDTGHAAAASSPHDRSATSDSCRKFCDDKTSALPKSLSSPADLPASLVVAFIDWPLDVLGVSAAALWLRWQTAAQGPPLVIRLQRLTL
ncbi:MAG: hypothetical protein C0505_14395 [Leptothrix sp. (in: Bacteria)]|nr:hypothetical protein [Leptothrix sp. (in: b-proteobacteria)]